MRPAWSSRWHRSPKDGSREEPRAVASTRVPRARGSVSESSTTTLVGALGGEWGSGSGTAALSARRRTPIAYLERARDRCSDSYRAAWQRVLRELGISIIASTGMRGPARSMVRSPWTEWRAPGIRQLEVERASVAALPCPPRTGFEVEVRPGAVMVPCSRAAGPPPGQASGSRPGGTSRRAVLSSRGRRRNSSGGAGRPGKIGNGRAPIRTIDGGCGALGNRTATDGTVSYAFEKVSLRARATNFPGPIRNDSLEDAAFDLLPGTVSDISIVRAHAYAVQGSACGSVYGEATHA